MQDNSLPNLTQPTPSAPIVPVQPHVDDYIPPTITPAANPTVVSDSVAGQSDQADLSSPPPSFKSGLPVSSVDTSDSPGVEISDKPSFEDSANDFKNPDPISSITGSDPAPTPPTMPQDSAITTPDDDSNSTQALETQNIFDLLGVSDGTPKEKEDFLDELQEVIWEDFVENDIELLLTEEEAKDFATIKVKGETPEVQEEMLAFLEKLIPDLEEIMMDKALELKGEMVQERISGMREFHVDNQEALAQIEKAEKAIVDGQWAEVATILNGISS